MSEEIYQVEIPELYLGRTLKNLREGAGYTMEVFGGMMGWNKSTVSKVEKGYRGISAEELYRAASILGKPISAFYPEVIAKDESDDKPSLYTYADEIRDMVSMLNESEGKLTPDIEEMAKSVFLREMPQTIYRLLNTTPNQVSVKGSLMRGPHFIPRIEIHYNGRRGYDIDWFYIVLTFKEGLKHIYLSLVQSTDIKFRVEYEPVDQVFQLDALRSYCVQFLHSVAIDPAKDWTILPEGSQVFLDDSGNPPENGTIHSCGYIPVGPPEAYDVTVNDTIYPDMEPFVVSNVNGEYDILGKEIPSMIVDTGHSEQELFDEEYALMDQLDDDIVSMFYQLGQLIEEAENGCFRRWKKEALSSMSISVDEGEGHSYKRVNQRIGHVDTVSRNYTVFNSIRKRVLEKHNYTCEVDPSHESFIDRSTGKKYMEIHHLIPLEAQGEFKKDLNCEANMICVCPICNRMLVRGDSAKVEDVIVPLYYSRREELKEAGIDISLRQLLQYYE